MCVCMCVCVCVYQLDQFLISDVFEAFSADGVNETHPIIQTVSNPDEINELFDSISYSKVCYISLSLSTSFTFTIALTMYVFNL